MDSWVENLQGLIQYCYYGFQLFFTSPLKRGKWRPWFNHTALNLHHWNLPNRLLFVMQEWHSFAIRIHLTIVINCNPKTASLLFWFVFLLPFTCWCLKFYFWKNINYFLTLWSHISALSMSHAKCWSGVKFWACLFHFYHYFQ